MLYLCNELHHNINISVIFLIIFFLPPTFLYELLMNLLVRVHQLNKDLVVLAGPDPPPESPARHPVVEPEVVLWTPPTAGSDPSQGRRDGLTGQVPELGRQPPQHVAV